MPIYILRNHDYSMAPIGHIDAEAHSLMVTFYEPVPKSMFFDMIQGAGMKVLEFEQRGDEQWLRKVEILEISVVPKPSEPFGSAKPAADTAT